VFQLPLLRRRFYSASFLRRTSAGILFPLKAPWLSTARLLVQTKFARTAIEICPHAYGPESQKLFCVRYACFFNCLPDATSIKSTRPARPNWAVKLTLLPIRGRAHQRDTEAPRCPGHFPARQRQRAVTSPGETTADATSNACA